MIPAKKFYMMRHGQTEANAAQIMAGTTDSPLTALGREQARQAQKVVAKLKTKPTAIFHSHLSRARDTAQIVNQPINAPLHENPDLGEINAGELEGAPYSECEHLFREWPSVKHGETPDEFFTRLKRGKTKAINAYESHILIVCHGGVMRGFAGIYGITIPGRFENAHLYEFIPTPENTKFPWTVFDYRLCENTNELIKTKSDLYVV